MLEKLKVKNILYSTDSILGYKESVGKVLKEKFSNVEYIEEYLPPKEERSIFFKILREITKKLNENNFLKKYYTSFERKHIKKILSKYNMKFDYFFVVAGREFSKEFIEELKLRNPDIKCIIYLWDKLEETSLRKSIKEFDYVFSFDPEDCKKYGFIFRPSFYSDKIKKKEKEIDFYYVGALRSKERYYYALNFYNYCKKNNIKSFIKIFVNNKNKKFLPREFCEEIVTFRKISYKENIILTSKAKVILDLNLSNQTGLTLRSIESVASETKIISKNLDIKNYDFYKKENIIIINNEADIFNIPSNFFQKEYKKVGEEIIRRYSAKGFIEEILLSIVKK